MSAVFEVNIFSSELSSYKKYISICDHFSANIMIDKIMVIDNWQFESQHELDLTIDDNEITDLVNDGKIIMIYGYVNSRHSCGLCISQVNKEVYSIHLWISTSKLPYLDQNFICCENEHVYKILRNYVHTSEKHSLIVCGIGVECVIKFTDEITDTIKFSHNVNEWILPKCANVQLISYTETQLADLIVLTKSA